MYQVWYYVDFLHADKHQSFSINVLRYQSIYLVLNIKVSTTILMDVVRITWIANQIVELLKGKYLIKDLKDFHL